MLSPDIKIPKGTPVSAHTEGADMCSLSNTKSSMQNNKTLSFFVRYQPVIAIAFASLSGAVMLSFSRAGGFDSHIFMHSMMGLFLLPLALLKMFDLNGFVASFEKYDVLTKVWRPYGYVYPFLELALALLFLSGLWLTSACIATLIIMGLGSIGIISQLSQGKQLDCACVGSVVKVPLGFISITENIGMVVMAAIMLSIN